MPMYNLIEYSNDYTKTPESVWKYHKDDLNDNITDSQLFKFQSKITGRNVDSYKSFEYLSD